MKTQLTITAAAATIALFLTAGPIAAAEPNWSASIGTGHSSQSATQKSTSQGAPASAHWTASIGTGNASQSASSQVRVSAQPQQPVASAHWASRIGTGAASESNERAKKDASTVVASVPELSE